MKYAAEVIDLLAGFPGRKFKMREIINHVAPRASQKQRTVIKVGVWRVLAALEESGQIESSRSDTPRGAHVRYWWKSITLSSKKHNVRGYNTAGASRP